MALEMRELRGDDLFVLLNIIGKIGIEDEIISLFEGTTAPLDPKKVEAIKKANAGDEDAIAKELSKLMEKLLERRGMEVAAKLAMKVFRNIELAKNEINQILADVCNVKVDKIQELGLKEYTEQVIAFFKKPELVDFFKSLASLLK